MSDPQDQPAPETPQETPISAPADRPPGLKAAWRRLYRENRSVRVAFWTSVAMAVLLVLGLWHLRTLRDWIEPLPGVVLTPALPSTQLADLTEDHPAVRLIAAMELPPEVARLLTSENLVLKLKNQGWCQGPGGELPPGPHTAIIEETENPPPAEPRPPPAVGKKEAEADEGAEVSGGSVRPYVAWTAEETVQVLEAVRVLDGRLQIISATLREGFPQFPGPADPMEPPAHLDAFSSFVDAIAGWARCKAASGHGEAAWQGLAASLSLTCAIGTGGGLAPFAAGAAAADTVSRAMWDLILVQGLPDARQTRALLTALGDLRTRQVPLADVLRYERESHLAKTDAMFRSMETPAGRREYRATRFGLWMAGLKGSDEATFHRNLDAVYTYMIQGAEEDERIITETLTSLLAANQSKAWRLRDPVGYFGALQMVSTVPNVLAVRRYRDTMAGLVPLFLATAAYTRDHGEAPRDAQALIPAYLETIPTDFFAKGEAAETLRLNVEEGGSWVVYSVGANGEDDGGKATCWGLRPPEGGEDSLNPDLVLPSTPFPEDPKSAAGPVSPGTPPPPPPLNGAP